MLEQTLRTLGLEGVGAGLGSAGGHLLSALQPLDYPRQSAYNLVQGLGEGDISKALPGLLGLGVGAASIPLGGLSLPLAALLGSGAGGLAQGMFGQQAATPDEAIKSITGRDSDPLTSLMFGMATDPLTYAGGLGGRAASAGLGEGIRAADNVAGHVAPLTYQSEALNAIRQPVADNASKFEGLLNETNAGNEQALAGWRDTQAATEAAHDAQRQQALQEFMQQHSHPIGGEQFFGPDVLAALQGEAPDVMSKLLANPGVRVADGGDKAMEILASLGYAHQLPDGRYALLTEGMPAQQGRGFLQGRLTAPRGGWPATLPAGPLDKIRSSVPEPFSFPPAPQVPRPELARPPQPDTISDVLNQMDTAGTGYGRQLERGLQGRHPTGGPFDQFAIPGAADDLASRLATPTPEALAGIDAGLSQNSARQQEVLAALGQQGGVPNWFYSKFLAPKI